MAEEVERAYLEIQDRRDSLTNPSVQTATTKNKLSGIVSMGKNQLQKEKKQTSNQLEVPFNPTSLTFRKGIKSPQNVRDVLEPSDHMTTEAVSAAKMTMEFQLIYDCSMEKDASIKEQLNPLLEAIRNPATRGIALHWGNLYYEGILKQSDVEYTMFDTHGIPIRANVTIHMNL